MEKKEKGELLAVLWAKLKDDPSHEGMRYNFIWDKHNL